jgi:tRNA pseudouridine55 synthase
MQAVADGVVLVDKPAGMTSHDVVAAVRRSLPRGTRVGHAGTLDPFATGLLLVLAGRATRVQRFLMALPKTYMTVARLGWTSTTGDPEGEVTETGRIPPDPPELPTGEVRQVPPMHSAIKVGGERLYRKARRGEKVEVPERTVTVHRFEQLARAGETATFAIECSSGTYVRSLIAALGDAYCLELRRMAIGPFEVESAVPPPHRGDGPPPIVPLDEALAFLPAVDLEGEAARMAGHGRAIPGEATGIVRLRDAQGLIALAEPREGGELKPVVGFRG